MLDSRSNLRLGFFNLLNQPLRPAFQHDFDLAPLQHQTLAAQVSVDLFENPRRQVVGLNPPPEVENRCLIRDRFQ